MKRQRTREEWEALAAYIKARALYQLHDGMRHRRWVELFIECERRMTTSEKEAT